jgi:diguanylate cyclase (GGDEF)-like protein
MLAKKRGILHAVVAVILVAVCVYFGFFISGLDKNAGPASNANGIPEPAAITSGWLFHWGDSPVDRNGNFVWLDPSRSNGSWESFQFPGRPVNPGDYDTIWIRNVLPAGAWQNPTLRFRAPQQAVELYLDGKLFYTYGKYDSNDKVRTPGSIWHLVSLPPDFAGKTVEFRLRTPFPQYAGYFIEIDIGERSSHVINIIKDCSASVIFGCLFILIGFGLILLQIAGSNEWRFLAYLGLSSIFMGGWYIAESKVLQLFFNAPVSMTYAANFFIFLMPVWLIIYIENTFSIKSEVQRQLLRALCYTHAVLAALAFTCDLTGMVSSLYFDKFLHIMIPISMLTIAFTIINSKRSNVLSTVLFISGILVLGITGILDTYVLFYNNFPALRIIKTSYIGMLFFLSTLLFNVGGELKEFYESLKLDSKESQMNYKNLFTNMTEGFTYNRLEFNSGGRISKCVILEANDSFIEKTGMEKAKVIGTNLFSIFPELKAANLNVYETEGELPPAEIKYPNEPISLGAKWYRLSAFRPKKNYLSIIFSDVTAMKNAEETIRRQAYTDSMTGFFNRTYFEDTMLRMYGMIQELKPLSMIVIDIDGLKITNDTFGHNVGDTLLKDVAGIISRVFKSGAIITRVGGDEFCIIMPNTSQAAVQEKTEQLVRETEGVNRQNPPVPISMSIGVATSCEEDHDDIYNIYRRADDDMYRYKISQSNSEKSKVIDMLLTALSERDYVSQGHVERLVDLCQLMGNAMNLHDIQKRNLILLSKVHDLGKIGIPDDILNKPGRLTPKEYERMKQHVKIGYNIASRSKELVTIAPLILHHHEHWDGGGYPDSLRAEEIPLECRILGIIDAFDAMTNDRPYHRGISREDAIREIEKNSGKQFDPDIVRNFIGIVAGQPANTTETDAQDAVNAQHPASVGQAVAG